MKKALERFTKSMLALLMFVSMFAGSTFAWFSEEVSSKNNIVTSGNLDLEMYWTDKLEGDNTVWTNVEDDANNAIFNYQYWEPGYTEMKYIKIVNAGKLAFKYQMNVIPTGAVGTLAEVIDVYTSEFETVPAQIVFKTRDDVKTMTKSDKTLIEMINTNTVFTEGKLLPDGQTETGFHSGEVILAVALHMQETAGNEYMNQSVGDGFSIQVVATQEVYEEDSFGNDYDKDSIFPEVDLPVSAGQDITGLVDANGYLTEEVTITGPNGISVTVPANVKVADGATALTLTITEKDSSDSNVVLDETEAMKAFDVHVEGVADDNTTPMTIRMGEVLPTALNKGNLDLYHVEGTTEPMTEVATEADFNAHNQFTYDPATGALTLHMATFSEVAVVADTVKGWEGAIAASFAGGTGTEADPYLIANADQLAYFGAAVGGMNGYTKTDFGGKTVKLISDINLGDAEKTNNANLIFYPIGYYNSTGSYEKASGDSVTSNVSSFSGTFDGAGHIISNFYQNTWEMFGDYNDGYSGTPNHYKDAMGLFGYVNGGTVKNLTVDNFSSDGEYTPTGVIAAYATNSTFENIAITNCNPRVYNTGNGGIVGIGGNSDDPETYKLTFTNITIDNSNKITALWGSWDVACGGLVGMFRGAGHAHMTNCHVAAQIDVYNDVCGNYQYYWYRYAGMMIGTNKNMITDDNGYTVPETSKFHAENCTVHFGEWNNYYYCELVANSLASYTHDHQFSRLVEVKKVEGNTITDLKGNVNTVPDSGRYNYVVVNGAPSTENATCYHFVDGRVWNHEDAGTETVNGTTVLKEDNQHIYLPFNQLFTGYGWGVKHIPIYDDGTPNPFSGVTILDRDVADSVEKFIKKDYDFTNIKSGDEIQIGDLFESKPGVTINTSALQVSVTDLTNTGITGTFIPNQEKWEEGKLIINGTNGYVNISIQDYMYCKPTVIKTMIGEFTSTDRIKVAFENSDSMLYRVGNANEVKLEKLFTAIDKNLAKNIGKVTVEIESEAGDVEGDFISNETWGEGTIKFTGTGVVTLNVIDDNYTTPITLTLEVIDAYNVTNYSELKNQTSVLLCNIEMSNGATYRLTGNKVLYGNGFTFDVTKGAYIGVNYDYESYVIYLEDSMLDNVRIEGAVYPELGYTKDSSYHRAIMMTGGDCKITNSYISNGASPIRNGGSLELINSTLKGGAWANLDLRNGHLILDNVTTINQANANDKYNDSTVVLGMGIVVYQEGGTEDLKITIRNSLNQYNYVSQAQADEYFSGTASTVKEQVFSDQFANYRNNGLLNFGILSMNNYFAKEDIIDERNDKQNYFGTAKKISLMGQERDCYVYSFKPTSTSIPEYKGYSTVGQGIIEPNISFDFTEKNYIEKTDGSNNYCYHDKGIVYISMDEGETFNWDTSILTASKNGIDLNYTVTMNGVDYTGKSISFNTAGEYIVKYSYRDNNNYKLNDGIIEKYEAQYVKELKITVAVVEESAKHAEFSFGANGTAYSAKTVNIGNKTYVMPDVSATVSGKIGSTTVSGVTVYYPITEMYTSDGVTEHKGSWYACFPIFKNALQIIDYANQGTGDAVTYNQTNVTKVNQIPSSLKATNPTSAFLYQMNANSYSPPTDPTAVSGAVCYTSNRNGLTASNTRTEFTISAEYTYTDNAGAVYYFYIGYHCPEQTNGGGTCLAEGTMITLADGTKRAIEDLRKGDSVLSFDHVTGEVTSNDVIIVVKTQSDFYKNTFVFSDGTELVTINEHGIYDLDLRQYVNIDHENYKEFIGHRFVSVDSDGKIGTKTLTAVKSVFESGYKYDIVTENTLNYVAEDTLSVTHVLVDIINTFEFDDNMMYDQNKMAQDIQKYGLYTYDEWEEHCDISVFEQYNIPVMKVGVSKDLYTKEYIISLIDTYVLDESKQIID